MLGCIDRGGKIKNCPFWHSDTLFLLYFLILRQVCFLAFFDLKPPSFAKFVFSKPSFSCSCISAIQHLFFYSFCCIFHRESYIFHRESCISLNKSFQKVAMISAFVLNCGISSWWCILARMKPSLASWPAIAAADSVTSFTLHSSEGRHLNLWRR